MSQIVPYYNLDLGLCDYEIVETKPAPQSSAIHEQSKNRAALFKLLAEKRGKSYFVNRRETLNPLAQIGRVGLAVLAAPLALPGCTPEDRAAPSHNADAGDLGDVADSSDFSDVVDAADSRDLPDVVDAGSDSDVPDVEDATQLVAFVRSDFTPLGTSLSLFDPNRDALIQNGDGTEFNFVSGHGDTIVERYPASVMGVNKLLLVNRFNAGGSVQVLDPYSQNANDPIEFGEGSNPSSAVVIDGFRAYVPLMSPASFMGENAGRADLLELDLMTGMVTGVLTLNNTNNSPVPLSQTPSPSDILQVGGLLYVAAQNLNNFTADTGGKVFVINPVNNAIVKTIDLACRNPWAMSAVDSAQKILVSCAGVYDFDFNGYNPNTDFGGIEVIRTDTKVSEGIVIDDLSFANNCGLGAIVSNEDEAFVVCGGPTAEGYKGEIYSFDYDNYYVAGAKVYSGRGEIHAIDWASRLNGGGSLVIGDRGRGLVQLEKINGQWQEIPVLETDAGTPISSLVAY